LLGWDGAELVVRKLGARLSEAESFLAFGCPVELANMLPLFILQIFIIVTSSTQKSHLLTPMGSKADIGWGADKNWQPLTPCGV